MLTCVLGDGSTLSASSRFLLRSRFICDMLDGRDETTIPLPMVPSAERMQRMLDQPPPNIEVHQLAEMITDADYLAMEDTLGEVIRQAIVIFENGPEESVEVLVNSLAPTVLFSIMQRVDLAKASEKLLFVPTFPLPYHLDYIVWNAGMFTRNLFSVTCEDTHRLIALRPDIKAKTELSQELLDTVRGFHEGRFDSSENLSFQTIGDLTCLCGMYGNLELLKKLDKGLLNLALLYAAQYNHWNVVEYCLDNDCNIYQALSHAWNSGNTNMVDRICERVNYPLNLFPRLSDICRYLISKGYISTLRELEGVFESGFWDNDAELCRMAIDAMCDGRFENRRVWYFICRYVEKCDNEEVLLALKPVFLKNKEKTKKEISKITGTTSTRYEMTSALFVTMHVPRTVNVAKTRQIIQDMIS